jgi:cell division protein FtsI/penicillin-binding protein 2
VRNLLAGLAAVLVLGAVVGTGWWLLEGGLDGPDEPGDTPQATAQAYFAAWEDGRYAEMASLVRQPPEDFREVHEQAVEGLGARGLTLEAGEVEEPEDGRALVDVRLAWEVDYTDELTWETELELLRERGSWDVAWRPAVLHPELRPGLVFDVEASAVDRAPILAADGTALSGAGDEVTFGFEPTAVDDADAVADAFEEAIPGSGADAARELARGDLVDGWFYPVVTVRAETAEEAGPVLREVDGILRRSGEGRTLLDTDFAVHVVGRVAEATAEQLDELGPPYEVGDEVGQFGLEAAFERDLTGSDEVRVLLRDGEGGAVRDTLAEFQADPSAPLETTLDVAVQRAVENALIGVEDTAAVVVVDSADGAIRGSASRPTTGYNRAFEGRYAPGSTFKLVTLEALLADGAGPDDDVTCPGEASLGGRRVTNSDDRDLGELTLSESFAESCNTTFGPLAIELGAEALTDAAERFGFGVEPDLGLAAAGGSFPDPGDDAEVGAASFGQARVTASPLHLASVAAATVTGTWHQPYLLLERNAELESRDLADGVLDELQAMLRQAVAEGTGGEADVDEGVRGKTGTAEVGDGVEHAWFIGTWEDHGFAVLVEEGGSGGAVAAPIAGRLVAELRTLLADPDEALPDDVDPEDARADGNDGADEPEAP